MAARLEAALRSLSLEAARLRRGKLRGHPGVFTRALDDPTPAWIACHIEHGREGQRNAILRSFRGRALRAVLSQVSGSNRQASASGTGKIVR